MGHLYNCFLVCLPDGFYWPNTLQVGPLEPCDRRWRRLGRLLGPQEGHDFHAARGLRLVRGLGTFGTLGDLDLSGFSMFFGTEIGSLMMFNGDTLWKYMKIHLKWIRKCHLKGKRERERRDGLRLSLFADAPIWSHLRKFKKQNT